MQTQELRSASIEELGKKLREYKIEYATAREAVHIGKEKNSAVLKDLRRKIARVATILREQQK